MKVGSEMIFIVLDKGHEDIALYNEIGKLISELKIKSINEFIKKYPMLNRLRGALEQELYYEK